MYEDERGDEKSLDRGKLYAYLRGLGGLYMGGSAYAFEIPPSQPASLWAANFWNKINGETSGAWFEGDVFVFHYPGNDANRMGFLAKCVPAGETSLRRVTLPELKA